LLENNLKPIEIRRNLLPFVRQQFFSALPERFLNFLCFLGFFPDILGLLAFAHGVGEFDHLILGLIGCKTGALGCGIILPVPVQPVSLYQQ
jgi:hypothetical protein